jgi:hypothetical protein
MARGKTLQSLLQDFRAAIRTSQNAAHNVSVRETHVRLLQSTQDLLWEAVDWPHLRVRRLIDLQAGQRYYSSDDDIHIDRLETIEVMYAGEWCPLYDGIGPEHYAAWNSDLDERSWPVERWQLYEDDMFEVWPLPAQNADDATLEGKLRLTGIRNLNPLVADDDTADLDNRLIVLTAAAETLAASGADDAALKLRAAEKRFNDLTANQSKMKTFKLFGKQPNAWKPKGPPRVHYRTDS